MTTTQRQNLLDAIDQIIDTLSARTGQPRPRFVECPHCRQAVVDQGGFYAAHGPLSALCPMSGRWARRGPVVRTARA